MSDMNYWDKLRTPPDTAKKKITGGRLKGMTDIKPQWRFEVMTKTFGPCGIGWRYEVVKQWLEQGYGENVCAFCDINLYIKDENDVWSHAIPGTGGNMFVTKESKGVHTSDEAFKMALTDAMSVAMKAIGVGSDVYMGYSDSKYAGNIKQEENKINPQIELDKYINYVEDFITREKPTKKQLEKWYMDRKLEVERTLKGQWLAKLLGHLKDTKEVLPDDK